MRDTNAVMAKNKTKGRKSAESSAKSSAESSDRQAALHLRYGQIGISAVAAAARYQGDAKNSAYAPVPPRANEREAAFS